MSKAKAKNRKSKLKRAEIKTKKALAKAEVKTKKALVKAEKVAKTVFDRTLLKFFLVGIINTIIGVGLKFLLLNLVPIDGSEGVLFAGVTSTAIASVVSYFLNKTYTFHNTERGIKPAIRFTVNIAACYAIAYVCAALPAIWLCETYNWTMFSMPPEDFAKNFSAMAETGLFVCCNYFGQRFFAFKEKK